MNTKKSNINIPKNRWGFHVCSPWSGDCSMRGIRLNIHTPWRFIYIALTPEGRVADRTDSKWVWFQTHKY